VAPRSPRASGSYARRGSAPDRPRGRPDAAGVLGVDGWNIDVHPGARRGPRGADRTIPRDAGGLRDAAVDALRKHEGRLQLRVDGRWQAHTTPSPAPPLVIVPAR